MQGLRVLGLRCPNNGIVCCNSLLARIIPLKRAAAASRCRCLSLPFAACLLPVIARLLPAACLLLPFGCRSLRRFQQLPLSGRIAKTSVNLQLTLSEIAG